MAPKPLFLLLLWGLVLSFSAVNSLCDVTCSTDYVVLLNCSCSDSLPTFPVSIEVTCSGEDMDVEGSCELRPPQSWCAMHLPSLDDVASVGTLCTARAGRHGDPHANDSSTWELSNVVKAWPPFNVQVVLTDGFYNITWSNNNSRHDCLTYNVSISKSVGLSKNPVHSLLSDEPFVLVNHKELQQRSDYTVVVQAKMCPDNLYQGPWSEWSPATSWRTTGGSVETKEIYENWWCLFLGVALVAFLLILGYKQKPFLQKRLQLITFVPRPNEFFKPLYHNYGGNFKDWVNPVFNEYDYLKIKSPLPPTSAKQHDVLRWNDEKPSYSEDRETKPEGRFLEALQPQCNALLHLQEDGSSEGTGHSMGHISIHTVIMSGEEFEEEAVSQSSMSTIRSYQDEDSFHSFEEVHRVHSGNDLSGVVGNQGGILPPHESRGYNGLSVEIHPQRAGFHEAERVSLVSFASNEHSEDGYPHVDLDTIDSGFAECGSPGASDTNKAEHMDSDLFSEHKNLNSNYVKQWMLCSSVQEDSSTTEHELQET